jgi:hypothetical protein
MILVGERPDRGRVPHEHLRSQRDLPVDPGGLAPGIALRHLPHADQRVGAAAQHQLLQAPDFRPVLLPRRLEDPLPQPPYVLLAGTPVQQRPTPARPQVRPPSPAPNLPLGSSGHNLLAFNGSPAHVSALSRPGTRPGIRPVIRGGRRRNRPCCRAFPLPFGGRHSLLGHPVPPGDSVPLTIGLPRRTGADPDGVSVFRTHETQLGWAPSIPGGSGVHATVPRSAVAACRFPAASPGHPGLATRPGELGLTGHHRGFTGIRPSSLPLACGPGTEPAPLGFP